MRVRPILLLLAALPLGGCVVAADVGPPVYGGVYVAPPAYYSPPPPAWRPYPRPYRHWGPPRGYYGPPGHWRRW
ncbi:hypothetical protein [Falsiroseomonas sp. CW058]|uniref:hypothetical protein n=1 Tax=Falsiroseomonas sp. CW058 TaxID=3388664 RepID=UPI003D31765B